MHEEKGRGLIGVISSVAIGPSPFLIDDEGMSDRGGYGNRQQNPPRVKQTSWEEQISPYEGIGAKHPMYSVRPSPPPPPPVFPDVRN